MEKMESLSPEKGNKIKNISNVFRIKKALNYTAIKDIRNPLRLKKEIKEIKNIVLRNIMNFFEYKKEDKKLL